MDSQESAQEQLAALQQQREQLRSRLMMPWWQHVLMGLVLGCLLVGQILLSDSAWSLACQGGTLLALFSAWKIRERTLDVRLDPPPGHRWTLAAIFVGGAGVAAILIFLSETFDARWPVVLGCVAIVVGGVLASIRHDPSTQPDPAGRAVTDPLFDPVVHEPTRLQLCGLLAAVDEAEFGPLRDTLGIADSVTSKHLKVLETPGYVRLTKRTPSVGRARTWVELTPRGRDAFAAHVAELRRLAAIAPAD